MIILATLFVFKEKSIPLSYMLKLKCLCLKIKTKSNKFSLDARHTVPIIEMSS